MNPSLCYRRIAVVFGTHPEAIKMAPLIKALRASSAFDIRVWVTGQHQEMLAQVMQLFDIAPDVDLAVMSPDQDLAALTGTLVKRMCELLNSWRADLVLVQGDTTTTFAMALAAYYTKIPVAHVEAGLRTGDVYSPWPEEICHSFR